MNISRFDYRFWAISLVLGQLLLAATSFFWKSNGRYSVNGGTLMELSMLFWAIGMMGLFDVLKEKTPFYARLGLLYAMYGIFGGVAFAFEGVYSEIFNVSDKIGAEAHQLFSTQMNILLFWSGPAFPLSLLILGIVYIRTKSFSRWVGALMALGAVAFPLSRISRTLWIAHLSDLLLLLPVCLIAYSFWTKNKP
ncbi:MAG: hypothetical protein U0X91_06150 [Spirosomataceae bacterium]